MIDDRYVSRYIAVFPSSVRPFVKGVTSQLFWIVDTQGKRAPILPPNPPSRVTRANSQPRAPVTPTHMYKIDHLSIRG